MHYLTKDRVNGKMGYAKHLGLIEKALHRINNGSLKRLIVTMPPQHGKSQLISVFFPMWLLGNNPHKRIIIVSYGYNLVKDFVTKTRDFLLESGKQIFNMILAKSSENEITVKGEIGYIIGTGIGGALTGKSADIMIIDDPIKNSIEANSPTIRENVWNYYKTTLRSRVQQDGAIVLIMTRWHSDDLVGRLLEKNVEQWEVINLPALAKENDLLGREIDEPLWEQRYNKKSLETTRIEIGSYFFSAMYQQEPIANEYTIFKPTWWGEYSEIPKLDMLIQAWDTAFKTSEKNDYSACITMGLGNDKVYILDFHQSKMIYPDLERKVKSKYAEFRPQSVLIEDAASGQSLIQSLSLLKKSDHIPVKAVETMNKVIRAHSVSGLVEAGLVLLPKHAPWKSDYINQLAAFPQGKNDDGVDATTIGLDYFKPKLIKTPPIVLPKKAERISKFTQGY